MLLVQVSVGCMLCWQVRAAASPEPVLLYASLCVQVVVQAIPLSLETRCHMCCHALLRSTVLRQVLEMHLALVPWYRRSRLPGLHTTRVSKQTTVHNKRSLRVYMRALFCWFQLACLISVGT